MATSTKKDDLKSLLDLATSSRALVLQYISALLPTTQQPSVSSLPAEPPNPLHVLRDSAKLLRAHVTKLSLLLLNKPFTPSALYTVLREISATCLPAMMSAVELCTADVWGELLRSEVQARVRGVMREMDVCLAEVLTVAETEGKIGSGVRKQTALKKNRDSLASTGVVWQACDAVLELETLDVGGLAVRKAEMYRDMIKDAIEELQDWGQEADSEDEDDDVADSADEAKGPMRDSIEDMFNANNKLPKDKPDLKKQLDEAIGKLKKINMLYTATIKRRLKTFTPAVARMAKHVSTMDEVINQLKEIPEMVDELANAFYELEPGMIELQIKAIVLEAEEVIKSIKLSWDGKEDEFTAWTTKWIEVIK